MTKFLTDNGWRWRLLRTIVQGVLGVIEANVDYYDVSRHPFR